MLLRNTSSTTFVAIFLALAMLGGCAGQAAQSEPAPKALRSNAIFQGQSGIRNGDFSAKSLDGWNVATHINHGLGSLSPSSVAELNLGQGDHQPTTGLRSCQRQSCTPAGLSELAALRYPYFGDTSVVINELGNHKRANTLSQRFVVTEDDFTADGQLHLHFARAAVLQSPNHNMGELPYFFSVLTNISRGGSIVYEEFHFAGDDASLWHEDPVDPEVLYTDWQLADMTANARQISPGDELELQLVAAGCAEGAHFGELYVEGFGTKMPGVTITSTGPAFANPNTTVDFVYEVANHGTTEAFDVVVTLPKVTNATFVALNAPSTASCITPSVGDANDCTCTLPSIGPEAVYKLTLSVHLPDDFEGDATAPSPSVKTKQSPAIFSAPIVASVQATANVADLTANIVSEAALCCDHNLGFVVTFSNLGPSEALGTHVAATFSTAPQTTTYNCTASNGASCSGSSFISGTGALDTNVDLPPNSALSCAVQATFPSSNTGLVTINGEIDAPSGVSDAYPSNNIASVFLSLAGAPSCSGSLSPGGSSCTSNSMCNSGFCVDGVCCNAACGAQCMACDNAYAPGICTPVLNEPPHGNRSTCGGFVCRQGACLTYCNTAGDCASGFVCQSNVCVSTQMCKTTSDCAAGTFCTPLGTCESPLQQRTDNPNWMVEGAGPIAQGCSQTHKSPSLLLWVMLTIIGATLRYVRRMPGRKSNISLLLFVMTIASSTLAAGQARAADDLSVAASHFQLWAGDEDIWATQSASVAPHLRWGFLGFFNTAHNLVRLVSTQNPSADLALIRYQETLDVGVTLGLARWVELSIAESFVWQQVNTAPFISTQLATEPHHFSVGDLRFAPKLALYRGEHVRLALSLAATFPTGRYASFIGNGTPTLTPKLLLDIGRRKGLRLMLNAGVLFRGKRQLIGRSIHDALSYGVGLGVPLIDNRLRLEALLSAVGEVGLQSAHVIDNPLEGHVGLRLWPTRTLAVDAGAGMGLTNGLGSPRWRVFVGIKTAFGGKEAANTQPQKITPAAQVVAAPPPVIVEAAPEPEPTPAPVVPGREPLVAISEVLLFELGKDKLTDDDLVLLDKVDAALSAHPEARISVDGHTDITGPLALNMRLSRQRADQAYNWLIEHGIAPERLERRGFGPRQPRASNKTREGRKHNRRVEFHLLEGGSASSSAQDPKRELVTPASAP